ncbi:hypothetical protein, partial [Acinetobacter baumannii]|uniref:hypothetical protein n=1 Tax=Acinetobacter baumannii TaxID=470 RepID=UPI000A5B84CF
CLILNRYFSASLEGSTVYLLTQLQNEIGQTECLKVYQQLRWLDDIIALTISQSAQKPQLIAHQLQILKDISPISIKAATTY